MKHQLTQEEKEQVAKYFDEVLFPAGWSDVGFPTKGIYLSDAEFSTIFGMLSFQMWLVSQATMKVGSAFLNALDLASKKINSIKNNRPPASFSKKVVFASTSQLLSGRQAIRDHYVAEISRLLGSSPVDVSQMISDLVCSLAYARKFAYKIGRWPDKLEQEKLSITEDQINNLIRSGSPDAAYTVEQMLWNSVWEDKLRISELSSPSE